MGATYSYISYLWTYSSNQNNEPSNEDSSEDEEFIAVSADSMDPNNFTTDATESQPIISQPSFWQSLDLRAVTEEKVIEFENNLEFYEKVSLVYLLYEHAFIALQHLIQLQQGAHLNVINEWVQFSKKTENNWQGKILEALCIIQNYEIIASLGYTRKNVDDRFSPQNPNSSMYINRFKKKMYLIFESLPNKDAQKFLEYAKSDFEEKSLQFMEFGVRYMEMYILHWMTVEYISPGDCTNLRKIFMNMGRFDISEGLKFDFPSTSRSEQTTENNAYNFPWISWMTPNKLLTSVSPGAGSSTMRKNSAEDQNYNIDPANPGLCLIINQQDFYREPNPALKDLLSKTIKDLDERIGTDIDRDTLKETFELFGFKVIVKNNLYHKQIIRAIKKTARMVTNHSSLVICILSHGIEGAVYGVNSIPVKVSKIQSLMNTTDLRNKPKILILQACQGTELQIVTENNEDEIILISEDDEDETITTDGPAGTTPTTADMLTFWATVPGYSAVRDEAKGTWFIQSLCKNIRSHADEKHFQDICTLVINEINNKRWGNKAMIPLHESTLSRFFFLPPKKYL